MKKGFTLVEILIYFAIIGVVMLAFISFSVQILTVSNITQNFGEVQSTLNLVNYKVTSAIHTADSVDVGNSVFDSDEGALSLNFSEASVSPTMFYFSAGDVYMKEGANTAVKLNSDDIAFSVFRFHRSIYNQAPDQIIFDAIISSKNVDISNVNKSVSSHLSITLRNL